MKIDLHAHSTASDGALEPLTVWDMACDQALDYFSLTDHDCLAGYQEIQQSIKAQALVKTVPNLVSGIEISSSFHGRCVHIIGLNFDDSDEQLLALVERLQAIRAQRAGDIASKLQQVLGLKQDILTDILDANDAEPWRLGRVHFARYLVAHDIVNSNVQAFKRFLGEGKKAYVATQWPDYKEVIEVIVAAGGIPVLAHPLKYGMTRTRVKAFVQAFAEAGGQAVEVVYQMQKPNDTSYLVDLCQRYQLYASAGSDFHDPAMTWTGIGLVPDLPEACRPVWSLFEKVTA